MTHTVTISNAQHAASVLARASEWIKRRVMAGRSVRLTVAEQKRTLPQNKLMWVILGAFSLQLKWPVNGELVYMTDEEWKDVLSAAFKNDVVRLAAGLDGGVVMLGLRTSPIKKDKFQDFLDFLMATAAKRGVIIESDQ